MLSLLVLVALARGRRPAELPGPGVLAFVVLSVAALGWDGVTSYAGWRTTTNEVRLATGLLMGWALPVIVMPMLNGQLWRRPLRVRVPDGWRELALWLLPLPVEFALVRWPAELTGLAYPLAVAVAILGTYLTVNLTIVSVLPFAEGRAERLRDAWLAILVACVLTVMEITLAGWLKLVLTRLGG
jgi:hypothetical protein